MGYARTRVFSACPYRRMSKTSRWGTVSNAAHSGQCTVPKQASGRSSSDASQRSSRSEVNQHHVSSNVTCDFCGFLAPSCYAKNCPAKKATCNLCHKRGHFDAVCRLRKKRHSHVQLLAVNASHELHHFVSVEVNGRALRFKVDLGADLSVVPPTFEGFPASLDPPGGEQLIRPGRNRYFMGTFSVTLTWCSRTIQQKLYEVQGIDTPLLGYEAIFGLGVIHQRRH